MTFDKIFLGVTPAEERNFLYSWMKKHLEDYDTIVLSCVGGFNTAKIAIMAGFKPENIYTSDISLYSSIIGYIYAGKPLSDLPFKIRDHNFQETYDLYDNDFDRAGYIFFLMKLDQFKSSLYEQVYLNDMKDNMNKIVKKLADDLRTRSEMYSGIHYEIADFREVGRREYDSRTLIFANPPILGGDYEKMFPLTFCDYSCPFGGFDPKKEYVSLFMDNVQRSHTTIWGREHDVPELIKPYLIFGNEGGGNKLRFLFSTKPEKSVFIQKDRKPYRPYKNTTLFGENDELTENSEVRFIMVDKEHGLYYRNLFMHRLGVSKSELYYLILIDGKVFSSIGIFLSQVNHRKSPYAAETFAPSIYSKRYPNINRLVSMLLTSKDMENVLLYTAYKQNRLNKIKGMTTTCLSKYRDIKPHHGIFTRTSREKLPNGLYKTQWESKWHDRSFKKCIADFIKESNEKYGST